MLSYDIELPTAHRMSETQTVLKLFYPILGLHMTSKKFKNLNVHPAKLFPTWYVNSSVVILHK